MQDATKLSKRIVAMGTCGGVGVVLLIFTYVYKDYIIINHHYKTWVICTRVAWSLLLLSIGAIIVAFIKKLVRERRKKEQLRMQEERESMRSDVRKLRDSSDIVKYLDNLRSNTRRSNHAGVLIGQLNEMDDCRRRLNELFEINDIDVFRNIIDIFQRLEDEMCGNCRSAINHYIAGGVDEFNASSEKTVEANDEKLKAARKVLTALADYTSGQASQDSVIEVLNRFAQNLEEV